MDPQIIRRRVEEKVAEQRQLVRTLLKLREQLQGSLFMRYGQCGKEACVCHSGQKHGPYYVLSLRAGGRGAFAYLGAEQIAEAKDLVARYREFRAGLRRVRKLNQDLVTLLRRYQATVSRRQGKRLGIEGRPS